ncbi:MAG: DUF58 domain-containing protein [Verrucomicrobiota bacterium]
MTPTTRLVYLLLLYAAFGFVASVWDGFAPAWRWAGIGGAVLLLFDIAILYGTKRPSVERKAPGRFALGVEEKVELSVVNPNRVPLRLTVFDGIPPESFSQHMPWEGTLPPRREMKVQYSLRVVKRGIRTFSSAHVRLLSPLGFWRRGIKCSQEESVRVYPNFEPILRLVILAMQHRESQMGIVKKNLAGVSREFHQLRDYHEGDSLNQIDWKATSKRLSIVSREYEEQRDQTIIFLLDCGRRMRAMDGELPQFDHCLNSMLLLSFIALRQGDHVGVLGFGESTRWLPPVKGQHSMNSILNFLYDFETEPVPSDFADAVGKCLSHQKRRALVVVLTNLRSEDSGELEPALRSLRAKHLVMLASLREREVDQKKEAEVRSLDDALSYHSAHLYSESREEVLFRLRNYGVLTLDETAQAMPVALANSYLEIKQQGRI